MSSWEISDDFYDLVNRRMQLPLMPSHPYPRGSSEEILVQRLGDCLSPLVLFPTCFVHLSICHLITQCHLRVPSPYPTLNIKNQLPSLEQKSYVQSLFRNQNSLKLATDLSAILNPQRNIFLHSATRKVSNQP